MSIERDLEQFAEVNNRNFPKADNRSLGVKSLEIQQPIEKEVPANTDWEITLEGYNPITQRAKEVINSLGNGYMGCRASISSFKEGVHQPAFYVGGVYETASHPEPEKEKIAPVADLVRIPDFMHFDISNGYEKFDIDTADLLLYKTGLNIKKGILTENIRWKDTQGRITVIETERILSQADPHIAVLRCKITPENYSGKITINTGIDGKVDNNGKKYLKETEKGEFENGSIYYAAKTINKNETVALSSKTCILSETEVVEAKSFTNCEDNKISQTIKINAQENNTYTLNKITSVYTSKDKGVEDPIKASQHSIAKTENIDEIFENHVDTWNKKWQECDIKIYGNEFIQKAVRYNLFKLMQVARADNEKVSIAAKGLDNIPGEGYLGHVFWDTEIFALPFFIHTNPDIARCLLMYRYHTLDAARQNAEKRGYKGALYPWESADTGEEATPSWVKDNNDKKIGIYTGEKEYHINADITYAIWEYYKATDDIEFLQNYGAEIIMETAKFWASKAQYNKDSDSYEIRSVIGPDEYHEKGPDGKLGVDNNYYTNAMAKWNIQKALDVRDLLSSDDLNFNAEEFDKKMGLNPDELDSLDKVASKMYLPVDKETGIFDQFEGYKGLKDIDLKDYPNINAIDAELRRQGKDPSQYKTIKQADVVLALFLLGETSRDVIKANYDYYSAKCPHGSSLSASTHAIMAIRAGYENEASKHLLDSALVDLRDNMGNNHVGSHIASCGGTWQTIVHGYAGILPKDDRLIINPSCTFEGLICNIRYHGPRLRIITDSKGVRISVEKNEKFTKPIHVEIKGKVHELMPGFDYIFPSFSNNGKAELSERETVLQVIN